MSLFIQTEIEKNDLFIIINSILTPFKFFLISDLEEVLSIDLTNYDDFIFINELSCNGVLWKNIEFGSGCDKVFEFEEYLAFQINKKFNYITVADVYRLMSESLKGSVASGFYSLLFEQDHSIYLVDNSNSYLEDIEELVKEPDLFNKLACLYPEKHREILIDGYCFYFYEHVLYVCEKKSNINCPIMQCDYIPLDRSDLT